MDQEPIIPSTPVDADITRTTSDAVPASLVFGPYRLLQRLGEGGMGEVWLAEQIQPIRRQVAVKLIKAGMDTAQVIARFEAERQTLAMMDHPGIATVFDAGTTPQGRPYFAMEYVRGESITTYCDRHRLTTRQRLELFVQVCDAVQHAHQKAVIHRDLKPSNVLVAVHGDQPTPKVIDFGVAKATTQHLAERTLFTELGALIGTPEYMSPEQAEMGGLDIDTRTDVYALGAILYELLSGALPFDSKTLREKGLDEIRRTIREVEPSRPSTRVTRSGPHGEQAAQNRDTDTAQLSRQLRGDLDWITMRALHKDRTRRYPTAHDLALDIRRSLHDEPVSAGPPSTVYRVGKFVRRHRVGVGAASTVAILLLVFSLTTALQARRIERERTRADREATAARQVSDFLVSLFQVTDPSESRGRTLTAQEILERGTRQIDGSLKEQPEVKARLAATIGEVYTNLGLYAEAEPQLREALQTQQRLLGRGHAETLATAHRLANLYWYLQRPTDAEPLYREVIEERTRTLGAEHPDTLKASFDLASVAALQKRWPEAERLTSQTLEIQRRVLGAEHPDTLASMQNLEVAFEKQGRFAEAEPIAVRVLELKRRVLGADHPSTLTAANNLASVREALGRYAEAEALYLEVIAVRRRILGEHHPRTSVTFTNLAVMYEKQRRYDEAEKAYLAAYEGYERSLGFEHETTRGIAARLVKLYTTWGKRAQTVEWQAKLTPRTSVRNDAVVATAGPTTERRPPE